MKLQAVLVVFVIHRAFSLPYTQRAKVDTLEWPRDVIGLFGDDEDPLLSAYVTKTAFKTSRSPQVTSTSNKGLGGFLASTEPQPGETTAIPIWSYTDIDIPGKQTISTGQFPITVSVTGISTPPAATTGVIKQLSSRPPDETEWKVIGVAVIAISFVAAIILSVVFFDSWLGFLRDMVIGRKRCAGAEDFVPDSEKWSNWEPKLADDDGGRYPSIPPLEPTMQEERTDADDNIGSPFTTHPKFKLSSNPSNFHCVTSLKATFSPRCHLASTSPTS